MKSEPIIIVTCDGDDGCTCRLEVHLTARNVARIRHEVRGYDERAVQVEIEADGWSTSDSGKDYCPSCTDFRAETGRSS